jgi:hypothetical protein
VIAPAVLLLACGPSQGLDPGAGGGAGGDGEFADARPSSSCAEGTYEASLVPLDMYLLMDHSQSMLIGGAWEQTVAAIDEFVSLPDPEGLSVGVGFFPVPPTSLPSCSSDSDCAPYDGPCSGGRCKGGDDITDSCELGDYAAPAVPISPLPTAAAPIRQAVAGQSEEGTTPMASAMQGAMSYLRDWSSSHPTHLPVLVLATDGMPSVCDPNGAGSPDRLADVAAVAADGLTADPPIKTFVVGYGLGDDLRAIADAGGTEVIDVSVSDIETQLLAALEDIRKTANCRYLLPEPPPGRDLDFDKVNVIVDGGQTVPKVGGAADCGPDGGWHYDDEGAPGHVVLCPATCEAVRLDQGRVDVELGCLTVVL